MMQQKSSLGTCMSLLSPQQSHTDSLYINQQTASSSQLTQQYSQCPPHPKRLWCRLFTQETRASISLPLTWPASSIPDLSVLQIIHLTTMRMIRQRPVLSLTLRRHRRPSAGEAPGQRCVSGISFSSANAMLEELLPGPYL